MQPGDVPATYASIERLRRADRLRAATPLAEGLARFVEWYRDYYGDAAARETRMLKSAAIHCATRSGAPLLDRCMILVTGGAGFIGSNFVLDWLARSDEPVVNLDKLTYAGNLGNLASLEGDPRHVFVHGDIGDRALVDALLAEHRPRAIVNFAAESHVDRSIHGPAAFVADQRRRHLHAARGGARVLGDAAPSAERAAFRFLHVSTDEVYGSLAPDDPPFTETTPYAPNSPYSASKAASDHLVRAYHHTYGLPTLTTNCSNNYGPLPVSREADPADDRQRARGQAAAGLRRRQQRARLALRRRPLRGDSRGARARPAGRDLQRRRRRTR